MGHVIIRAVPAVGYEDIGNPIGCFQAVHHGAESPELIFEMNGLDKGIQICMRIKIIKGVQMNAVEAFCGMALRNKIVLRGPVWSAEKGEGRTVSGKEPVMGGRLRF